MTNTPRNSHNVLISRQVLGAPRFGVKDYAHTSLIYNYWKTRYDRCLDYDQTPV